MEDLEILNIWKSYDKKLENSLLLNKINAQEITKIKVQSLISSMKPIKIFTLICGILWVAFLDVLIVNLFHIASPFFLVSAIILTLLNKFAIGVYLYQIIIIHEVDISEPIISTQEKLANLKSSTIWVTRVLFLQLPVWTTFYLNKNLTLSGDLAYWLINGTITFFFTYIAIWLFFNIKYENRDKKWFNLIFNGKEWYPVMKSMELLEQIKEYRDED